MPRRFRFYHPREDADDGGDIVAGYLDETPWLCEVCGEYTHNSAHWTQCVVCNEPAGAWLCHPCGHLNSAHSKRCETCGIRKEDA